MTESEDHTGNICGLIEALQSKLDRLIEKVEVVERSLACRPELQTKVREESGWIKLPDGERLKATDLRTALLLGKVPETAGLMIDTKTTAKLLNVSSSTLSRLDDLQAIPQPIRIGGTIIRWRLAEILAWMDAGCPLRKTWTYPEEVERTKRRR